MKGRPKGDAPKQGAGPGFGFVRPVMAKAPRWGHGALPHGGVATVGRVSGRRSREVGLGRVEVII